ncbi:MAG: glutamyl-tRNA reductase [Burkholderiaceae bacterium]
MAVWALGLNHNTAPLDLRGRFAFAVEQIASVLSSLRDTVGSQTEAAILSTCNRTEVYCAADQFALDQTMSWLAQSGGVSPQTLSAHTYTLQDAHVARHAFRVASGLDSMVLGEPQILGQMKDAVRIARENGALGVTLHQMFQRSFSIAKQVRTSTEIGAHSISMAAATVRLASQLFEELSKIHVLFVGAGEMVELCGTHFAAKAPQSMTVANRTLERAEKLASQWGANVMRLADLPDRLHEFDAVISCTASSLPLIGLGAVERALKKRRQRPMLMVDLAVPRDIEPEVKPLDNIYLYTVDDLAQVVQTGQANRQAAVAQAEVIIDAGVQNFLHWLDHRSDVPLIQQLNAQADAWRVHELQRAQKMVAKGDSIESVLEAMSKSITQKMLHGAMSELHASDPQSRELARQAIEQFFLRGNR